MVSALVLVWVPVLVVVLLRVLLVSGVVSVGRLPLRALVPAVLVLLGSVLVLVVGRRRGLVVAGRRLGLSSARRIGRISPGC